MKKEDDALHTSQKASADDIETVKEEDLGSAAEAMQQDIKQGGPEQSERKGHGSKRSAEPVAEKTSAKKAKKGDQGSSPPARKMGPMDSFLIKNPI